MHVKFSKDISVKCKMAGDYAFSWNLIILTNSYCLVISILVLTIFYYLNFDINNKI